MNATYAAAAALAVLLSAYGSFPANAAFISRDSLLRACSAPNAAQRADCEAYIAGVADTLMVGGEGTDRTLCLPAHARLRAVRDAVVGYLQTHRSGPEISAASAVSTALRGLYSCPAR
jgi:hypothetical protein